MADSTSLPEMASEATGRNDFTFTNIGTPNSRFYIKGPAAESCREVKNLKKWKERAKTPRIRFQRKY